VDAHIEKKSRSNNFARRRGGVGPEILWQKKPETGKRERNC